MFQMLQSSHCFCMCFHAKRAAVIGVTFIEEIDACGTPWGLSGCSQSMWRKICNHTRQRNCFIFSSIHLNACVPRPQGDGTAFRLRQAACVDQRRVQNVAQQQVAEETGGANFLWIAKQQTSRQRLPCFCGERVINAKRQPNHRVGEAGDVNTCDRLMTNHWPVGLMDKASASGAGDSRLES